MIQYERILKGEAMVHIVGDLGTLLPIPSMQFENDMARLYYCYNIAYQKISMQNNPQMQMLTPGGQIAVGLMSMGLCRVTIADYAPSTFRDIIRGLLGDLIGKYDRTYLYYYQISLASWKSQGGLDTEIGNRLNALREQGGKDILIDGRDRNWWEDFFPNWQEMAKKFTESAKDYLPRKEKERMNDVSN